MHWFENIRPMREPWSLDNKKYVAMADVINIQHEEELFGEDWLERKLSNKYYFGCQIWKIRRTRRN